MSTCPIPQHQADQAAAEALLAYQQPVSAQDYQRLIIWLKHEHWPVFPAVATFLGRQGIAAEAAVLRVLHSNNGLWKQNLVKHVLTNWTREDLVALPISLPNLITDPDLFGPDLATAQLLLRHHLVDSDWLKQWLAHKQKTLAKKLGEVEALIHQLEDA